MFLKYTLPLLISIANTLEGSYRLLKNTTEISHNWSELLWNACSNTLVPWLAKQHHVPVGGKLTSQVNALVVTRSQLCHTGKTWLAQLHLNIGENWFKHLHQIWFEHSKLSNMNDH